MAGPGCGGKVEWRQHPKEFPYFCDGVAYVEKVSWRSWGGARAKARATMNEAALNSHNSAATAPRLRTPVTVVASQIKRCDGRRAYTAIVIHFPSRNGNAKKLPLHSYLPRCEAKGAHPSPLRAAEFRARPSGIACGLYDGERGVIPGAKCQTASSPAATEVGKVYVAQIGPSGNVNRCSEPLHDPEDFCEWGNLGENAPEYSPGKQVSVGRFSCKVLEAGVECTVTASGKGFLIEPGEIATVGA